MRALNLLAETSVSKVDLLEIPEPTENIQRIGVPSIKKRRASNQPKEPDANENRNADGQAGGTARRGIDQPALQVLLENDDFPIPQQLPIIPEPMPQLRKTRKQEFENLENKTPVDRNDNASQIPVQSPIVSYQQEIQSIIPDDFSENQYVPSFSQPLPANNVLSSACLNKSDIFDKICRISDIMSSKLEVSEDEPDIDINVSNIQKNSRNHSSEKLLNLNDCIKSEEMNQQNNFSIPHNQKFRSMKQGYFVKHKQVEDFDRSFEIDNIIILDELVPEVMQYTTDYQQKEYVRVRSHPSLVATKNIVDLQLKNISGARNDHKNKQKSQVLSKNRSFLASLALTAKELCVKLYNSSEFQGHNQNQQQLTQCQGQREWCQKQYIKYVKQPLTIFPSYGEVFPFLLNNPETSSLIDRQWQENQVICEENNRLIDLLSTQQLLYTNKDNQYQIRANLHVNALFFLLNVKIINVVNCHVKKLYFNCPSCTEIFISLMTELLQLDCRRCIILKQLIIDGDFEFTSVLVNRIQWYVKEGSLTTITIFE